MSTVLTFGFDVVCPYAWLASRKVEAMRLLGATAHGQELAVVDAPATKAALWATTHAALDEGAFGVPSYTWGDRLWWGGDRPPLVEQALGRAPQRRTPAPRGRPTLRFFHDFASPFSYLASTQVARVAREPGATLEYVPLLLGGLFRDIGTADVPLFTSSEARQRWTRRDLADWATWWGVPFRFRSAFPRRTVAALRAALLHPTLTDALYWAAWVEDRHIGDPTVLARLLEALGLCGVPSFHVSDGDPGVLFWGQDRLDHVGLALDGRSPPVDTPEAPSP